MNTAIPGVARNTTGKKKPIRIIAICLVVALLAGGAYIFLKSRSNTNGAAVAQRTSVVIRGELTDSITGSAPIVSSNRSELSPKVTATLEKINIKEGDQVKAGDVLFVLDNTDALLEIENAENSIDQMQLTLESTAKSVKGLVVEAPFSGQITNIGVKEGDAINKGGSILTLTDVSRLDVTLAFSGSEVKNISLGQKATVYLQDLMLSVEGSVAYISNRPYTTASGGELYNVEITVDNPGSLKENMKATAEITVGGTTLESVDSGTLAYVNAKVLRSDAGGTITELNVRENEYVNKGDVLMKLENDELLLTSSTNNMKMDNLKAQLEIKKKQLTYYTITAPFDGTITRMGTANEGDTVKTGEALAVLSDMKHLEFSVDIDELDISSLAVGQEVRITSDAIEETATTSLTGKVTSVAMEGSSSNGVTTYPVTVTVDDESAAKLKTGMNIDAEIITASKSDILMVPLEAVTTLGGRSFVYVKGDGGQNSESGQFGRNSDNPGFNGPPSGNSSGSAVRGAPPDGAAPSTGNTSGSAVRRQGQGQNGNTSGSAVRRQGQGQDGNTSGSAVRRQGQGQDGNTSGAGIGESAQENGTPPSGGWGEGGSTTQGAVRGSFARARNANMDSYYDGAYMVEVQTGISNDSYIEITGGLTEGQTIVLPKSSTSSTSGSGSGNRWNQGGGSNIRIQGGMMGGAAAPAGGPGGF